MAVKVKVKGETVAGATVASELAKYQKKLGPTIGNYGGLPTQAERIPTGLFPLDLSMGGGFPRGRVSIIYGPEDSGKTSVAYRAIANHQRLWPELTCVYVAIEPFDAEWAKRLGVNLDKIVVLNPLFAEEAADMIGDMLDADDCGLVVLDSLAAMITTQEAEKSAEGFNPGSAALAVGKLVRKSQLALRSAERAGRSPSLIYINQTRFKIGVMFGNPEIMPGGNAPLFQSQFTVRFYGKAVKDSKVSDKYPVMREISFKFKKCKVPIISDEGIANMVTYPHNNLVPGETDDINTITAFLKDFGAIEQQKKGWKVLGVDYPTMAAFKDRIYSDKAFGAEIRQAIISRVLEEHNGGIEGPQEEMQVDEDGVIIEKGAADGAETSKG